MNDRTPVTIFTGFLGSGKTTILKNLIQQKEDYRFVALINEAGEASIDGDTIRQNAGHGWVKVYDIANKLVGYSDDDMFVETMLSLVEQRKSLDHILIETSGLAVPTAVIAKLNDPKLSKHFVIDATLTVVDVPLLLAGKFGANTKETNHDADSASNVVFSKQLEASDVVILNKIDLLSEDDLLKSEKLVRTIAKDIRFIELAHNANIDAEVALGLHLNELVASPFFTHMSGVGHADGHTHSGLAPHEHGIMTHEHIHEHDPGWLAFMLHCDQSQKLNDMEKILNKLTNSEPVLRIKGIIYSNNKAYDVQAVRSRVVIQELDEAARHLLEHHSHDDHHHHEHDHHTHSAVSLEEKTISKLVFIGYHLQREKITVLLSEMTQTNWT